MPFNPMSYRLEAREDLHKILEAAIARPAGVLITPASANDVHQLYFTLNQYRRAFEAQAINDKLRYSHLTIKRRDKATPPHLWVGIDKIRFVVSDAATQEEVAREE